MVVDVKSSRAEFGRIEVEEAGKRKRKEEGGIRLRV